MIEQTNGHDVPERIETALKDDATVGYIPTIPLEAMWTGGSGDMPNITLRRDIELMQLHPIVFTALEYYKSGIAGTKFWGGPDYANPENDGGKPISQDARVAQFVLAHAERFWQRGMPILQEGGYPYGWAPGEHMYKEAGGMMIWSHLKAFHPHDGFILTENHLPVGVRIKSIRGPVFEDPRDQKQDSPRKKAGTVDLWFASNAIPAKAAWYSHRPRFGQHYGRTQLAGGHRPWRRLGYRDAVEQVIDAAIYRAGYKGPVVRHPPEDMQTALSGIPATRADSRGGQRRSAQDVARQIVEWAKAGAGFTLSSAQYPPAQGGGPKWDIEFPDHVMDVRPLIEGARYLEDQIMLGIGVPPELVKAGGTGSGYSGRSIPREAFLDGQQRIADAMLQMFVEQVIRPLVLLNFGDVPFEISCKSILQSQMEDSGQGGEGNGNVDMKRSQSAKDAWQMRKVNEGGGQADPNAAQSGAAPAPGGAPAPGAFAIDPAHRQRVLDVVRKVLQQRAA